MTLNAGRQVSMRRHQMHPLQLVNGGTSSKDNLKDGASRIVPDNPIHSTPR
jgi:hypothetical protein